MPVRPSAECTSSASGVWKVSPGASSQLHTSGFRPIDSRLFSKFDTSVAARNEPE